MMVMMKKRFCLVDGAAVQAKNPLFFHHKKRNTNKKCFFFQWQQRIGTNLGHTHTYAAWHTCVCPADSGITRNVLEKIS